MTNSPTWRSLGKDHVDVTATGKGWKQGAQPNGAAPSPFVVMLGRFSLGFRD
jgi:hypothetical protein